MIAHIEIISDGGTGVQRAGGGGIAVQNERILCFHQLLDHLSCLRRDRYGRIAERIVKNMLRPKLAGLLLTVFKQLADARALGTKLIHRIHKHLILRLLKNLLPVRNGVR